MTKRTLFLDFDGVLHPYTAPTARLFEHVAHFERVMRRFPEWQIVISSSWREHESLEQLRSHFSPDIAERIVGVTPMFHKLDKVPFNVRHYEREVECRAWLAANGLTNAPWIALDDWTWLFGPYCPHLFPVNTTTGLDSDHALELARRLRWL